ncbi:MAG: LLM class F420-dependent oxidoreductase [Dehalococcoidia bacterium]
MLFGVEVTSTDTGMPIVELAQRAEALGFESLFLPEHTHVPLDRSSRYPGGQLPSGVARLLDPFVALGAAAAVTARLKLGTGVCLVPQHDPITLAKRVASLDHLSGGRFLFGIGAGWNVQETANHGTVPEQRWRVMRERVLAMQRIWTEDEPSFHGRHVAFDPIWSWPKPVQRPHPPILVGGSGGPHTFDRVVAYGDGWFPGLARFESELGEGVERLHALAAAAGRPSPVPITLFGVPEDRSRIDAYARAGVVRCVFPIASDNPAHVIDELARCAVVMRAGS